MLFYWRFSLSFPFLFFSEEGHFLCVNNISDFSVCLTKPTNGIFSFSFFFRFVLDTFIRFFLLATDELTS